MFIRALARVRVFECILISSIFLLQACTLSSFQPHPKPLGQPLSTAQSDQFIAKLRALDQEIRSFRGLSRSSFFYRDQRSALRHIVAFERPNNLRLEGLPTTAATSLFLLVVSEGKYTFLDPASKEAVAGAMEQGTIQSLLKIPCSQEELFSLLTGRLPQSLLRKESKKFLYDEEHQTVSLVIRDFESYWIFDAESLALQSVQIRNAFTDKLSLSARYAEYETIDGVRIPKVIHLKVPQEKVKIELKFTTISVNKDLRPEIFRVEVPRDYVVRER